MCFVTTVRLFVKNGTINNCFVTQTKRLVAETNCAAL